jgi:hypothetical protein
LAERPTCAAADARGTPASPRYPPRRVARLSNTLGTPDHVGPARRGSYTDSTFVQPNPPSRFEGGVSALNALRSTTGRQTAAWRIAMRCVKNPSSAWIQVAKKSIAVLASLWIR